MDFEFPAGTADFVADEPDFNIWIKETIMTALKFIVRFMKQRMGQNDAFVLFELLKKTLDAF